MKKNSFVKGALILCVGGFICKALGAIYRIPLSNILGANGIGLYQLVFPLYSLALVLITGGLTNAETKLISSLTASGQTRYHKCVFKASLTLMLVLSLVLSALFVFLSRPLAILCGNEEAWIGFVIISLSIVFSSIIAAIRGYYQGLEQMTPTAASQIVEQGSKLVLGLVLAFVLSRQNAAYGFVGAVLGVTLSEIVSVIFLVVFMISRKMKYKLQEKPMNLPQVYKRLLALALPMTIGAVVLPFTLAIDSVLIVNLLKGSGFDKQLSTSLFGVQSGMVNSLVNFPAIFSSSIAISLLPSISSSFAAGNTKLVAKKVALSFKLVLTIALPFMIGMFLLAPQIMQALYKGVDDSLVKVGGDLLRVSSFSVFYIGFLQVSTAVLQSIGKVITPAVNMFAACVIKVLLTVALVSIPSINILGAAIASVGAYMLASVINLIYVKKYTGFIVNSTEVSKLMLVNSVVAFMIMALFIACKFVLSDFISIIITAGVCAAIYLGLIFILRLLSKREIKESAESE